MFRRPLGPPVFVSEGTTPFTASWSHTVTTSTMAHRTPEGAEGAMSTVVHEDGELWYKAAPASRTG